MSSEEKKFKLDELPDEGGQPLKNSPPGKKQKKQEVEPRLEKLKTLGPSSKVEMMVQRWEFDEPIKSYLWLGYLFILCVLEFGPLPNVYMREVEAMGRMSGTMGTIWLENASLIDTIVRHPIILVIFAPFFYRGPRKSEYAFTISFDGIDTVKKYLAPESKELVSRTFIKWKEVERVEKMNIGQKEILRLFAVDGHIGDIIWYIELTKKKALYLLLKGMIIPQHPIRVFLENEKELK
jgi:hypothetical protein